MRLIDADEPKRKYAGWYNIAGKERSIRCVETKEIDWMPTIDAVPLDKLCELLAKNADCPPEHSPVQDHCIQTKCAECWKSILTEWMEESNRDAE